MVTVSQTDLNHYHSIILQQNAEMWNWDIKEKNMQGN